MIATLVMIALDAEGNFQQRSTVKFTDPATLLEDWDRIRKYPRFQFFIYTSKAEKPGEDVLSEPEWNGPNKSCHLWCPYCAEKRDFSYDPELELHRCDVCTVSTSEFYVRRYNGRD